MAPLLLANEPHFEKYKTGEYINPRYIDERTSKRRRRTPRQDRRKFSPPPSRWSSFSDSDYGSNTSFFRRRRRNFATKGRKGRDIVFYLNLFVKGPETLERTTKKRTNTWGNLHPEAGKRTVDKLDILASMSYSDEGGDSHIDLKCIDPSKVTKETPKNFISWRHIQRDKMSLEELELFALQTPNISDDMKVVVRRLMDKVNQDLIKSFRHGNYDTPASYRYDGQPSSNMDEVDTYATWLSFPYLTLINNRSHTPTSPSSSQLHPPRSLFQTLYDNESTEERDMEQEFVKHTKNNDGKALHVAHVWFLVLGEDIVISSASESLDNLLKPTISQQFGSEDGPKIVKVLDPYRRQFFLPLENCRNFFTFRQIVAEECLSDVAIQIDNCTFIYDNGKAVLTSSTWHEFLLSSKLPILTVEIKEARFLSAADTSSQVDSGSNEDSDSDNTEILERSSNPLPNQNTALILSEKQQQRRHSKERERHQKRVQGLRKEGLIINDTDTVRNSGNVKLFKAREANDPSRKQRAEFEKNDEGQAHPESREKRQGASNKSPTKGLVDPFLTWPLDTGLEPSSKEPRKGITDSEGLQHVLDRLNEKIKDSTYESVSWLPYSVTKYYEHGQFYESVHSAKLKGLDLSIGDVERMEQSGTDRRRNGNTSLNDSSARQENGPPDLYIWRQEGQKAKMVQLVSQMIRQSRSLVSLFAPTSFPHPLLDKIWGSLAILRTIISNAVNDRAHKPGSSTTGQQTQKNSWKVRIEKDFSPEIHPNYTIPSPQVKYTECDSCVESKTYESADAAIKHIMQVHYPNIRSFTALDEEKLHFWIQDSDQELQEEWNSQRLRILGDCSQDLTSIYKTAQDIHDGLATGKEENEEIPTSLTLPTALVKAFETATAFLLSIAHTLPLVDKRFIAAARQRTAVGEDIGEFRDYLGYLGMRAMVAMTKAREDVTLMVRTDMQASTVNYAAVGPRYIIMSICKELPKRKLHNGKRYTKVYQDIVTRMRYEVYHGRPARRLLTDIQRLHEELNAIELLIGDQDWSLWELTANSASDSFRITTQFRRQQARLEDESSDQFYRAVEKDRDVIYELLRRLQQLEDTAKRRIEILDEDHGKAIFVFTVVTIIFLPLSFVTSYLGMNTADIRDMNNTQSLFWAVGLPVTAVVLALGTAVAYKGDTIREHFRGVKKWQTEPETFDSGEPGDSAPRSLGFNGRKRPSEGPKWFRRRHQSGPLAEV